MYRKHSLLFFVLSLLLLAGCSALQNEKIVFEYAPQSIEYSEGSYSFRKDLDSMQTSHARYYFESTITDEQRQSCVDATEQILKKLGPIEDLIEICVLDKVLYDGVYISGNTLYLCPQDWYSTDYTTKVLLTASGQGSHYGLAYGYANILCEQLGWSGVEDGQFAAPTVAEVCDLNYLCFDNAFASETDIRAAQETARSFAAVYAAQSGDEALWQLLRDSDTSAGMDAVASALEEYYVANGLDTDISTVRYSYGGISNDYVVVSDYGMFYISDGWIDESREANPLVSENFLHENYPEVRQFFEINLLQFAQYQELFALDSYKNDLSIVFTNSTTYSSAGVSMYYLDRHTIYLKSVLDLTHEYIHSLTIPSAAVELDEWSTEGIATYFSVLFDYYSRDFLNQDYNSISFLQEYSNTIGRPLDIVTDNDVIVHLVAHHMGCKDPNENYLAGASFVGYLVNEFGMECVVDHLFGDGNALPKPHRSLAEDWKSFLDSYSPIDP